MEQEEVKEIPLIYPLVSVTIRSVSVVDGNRVLHECEEIVNIKSTGPKELAKLANDFRAYVNAVIRQATSQQGRDALQNIRDTPPQEQLRRPEDPPSSTPAQAAGDQGKESGDWPEE